MNSINEIFTFQNVITTTGQGAILNVGNRTELVVDIYGTATSRTVQFYKINDNGDSILINGFNETTMGMSSSTSGTSSETWSFDISGQNKIYMNVSTISGGNLTVTGRVIWR